MPEKAVLKAFTARFAGFGYNIAACIVYALYGLLNGPFIWQG
jgi:hypothetical protein